MNGVKYDQEKLRFSLVPWREFIEVVKVLMHGSHKYEDHNWQRVPNARERYFNAMMRHVMAWWNDEVNDPETKLNHLAHAICCALFLMWADKEGKHASKKPRVHMDKRTR